MNTEYKHIDAYNDKHGWIKEVYGDTLIRTKYSPNEIRVYEDGCCEIDVYDNLGRYKETGEFSEQDLPVILPHKWYSDASGYLSTTIEGKKIRLHKLLFSDTLIDHYDENKLNNTRENLQPTTSSINIIKIKNKNISNTSGVRGVSFTSNHKWHAYIEINKHRYNKTYNTKEEAIIQRYIWEINFLGKNAPQLDNIKKTYPRLAIGLLPNIQINDDASQVLQILNKLADEPHCPCRVFKTPDTKCMCREFREQEEGMCHCQLYIKVKE